MRTSEKETLPDYEKDFLQKTIQQQTLHQKTQQELSQKLYSLEEEKANLSVVRINEEEENLLKGFLDDYEKSISENASEFFIQLDKCKTKEGESQLKQIFMDDEFLFKPLAFKEKLTSNKKQRLISSPAKNQLIIWFF